MRLLSSALVRYSLSHYSSIKAIGASIGCTKGISPCRNLPFCQGFKALFRLLDGRSDDARRHGVQVELQNGRADPRRRSGGTLQSLSAHSKKRAILRSTVKYMSHGTATNERIMPVEAISIS